ncbi:MAG: universal stress protein [Raoultibacter sp.]
MAITKILVAYDGSELADKALDLALDIVRHNTEAHADIVNVVPVPFLTETQAANFQEITNMMMQDGKEVLYRVSDKIEGVVDQIVTLLLAGVAPASELLKMANSGSYDLMVVGNRGLSGLKQYMGSVSYRVFHESTIPVLIAK